MTYSIMHFDTDDVAALIGREPTDGEYRDIVNSLACNEALTELFTDTVYTFTTDRDEIVGHDVGQHDDAQHGDADCCTWCE